MDVLRRKIKSGKLASAPHCVGVATLSAAKNRSSKYIYPRRPEFISGGVNVNITCRPEFISGPHPTSDHAISDQARNDVHSCYTKYIYPEVFV